jgi:15-cis-phytoene synthase/lycopene beta-cyclase
MCFFLVTNLILISASLAFDTCALQLRRTHASQTTPLSPSYMPLRASSLAALWTAFVAAPTGPSAADADAEVAERVLSRASASFAAAARLLPWDLRRDLASLYALCRAADDAIDEAPLSAAEQRARLELLHAVGAAAFCQDEAQSDEAARAAVRSATQAYAAAKGSLGAQGLEELRACACACIPLRRLVPLALWQELLRGYAIDVALGGAGGRVFTQPQELLDYAQCVAGVVGEMCVRVVLGRSGAPVPRSLAVSRDVDAAPPREALALLLWQARRMGVALQLVNVARDVVGDARTLRRCYLVFERPEDAWMAPALAAGQLGDGTPSSKGPTAAQLRPHVLALLQRAEGLFASAAPALDDVPSRPARAGLRAACAVYFDIAQVIRHQPREAWERGDRAVVPKWRRAVVALRAVYA